MVDRSRTEAGFDRGLAAGAGPGAGAPRPAVTDTDRQIARLLLTGVVVGGALLALRVPAVRRVAWRAGRAALVGWLPTLLAREAREVWALAAERPAAGAPAPPADVPPPGPASGA
jgi:hypothetical protein